MGEGGGVDWDVGIGVYSVLSIKQISNENWLDNTEFYVMLCGDLNERHIHGRGAVCVLVADSLHHTAETNTLWSNYPPTEHFFKE